MSSFIIQDYIYGCFKKIDTAISTHTLTWSVTH